MKPIYSSALRAVLLLALCAGTSWLLVTVFAGAAAHAQSDPFFARRRAMVERDIKGRAISDPAVLKAMEKVPRHLFVDARLRDEAYADYPLLIGEGQTISQPYIVALMTQSLNLKKQDKVLEIGTGSGYQAAVLAEIVQQVYTVEIIASLAARAAALLKTIGYRNIQCRAGDGFQGWKEHAPYDAILVTCAVGSIPPPLAAQLKEGGRIILPLGDARSVQTLVLGVKKGGSIEKKNMSAVRFVPMTGEVRGRNGSSE
jgi:protein-L-isoaspartate(D-aspartate) O-methyltransferase